MLGIGALAAFTLFSFTWLLSRRLDNYSFVDITWSYALAVIVPLYAALTPGHDTRQALVLVMACLWSARLGTHLLLRIRKHHPHEDVRYQVLRAKWADDLGMKFFLFFQAQAALIAALSAPMLLVLRNDAPRMAWVEWLGFGVWLVGFLGESLADWQMRRFKADSSSKGKVCNVGLWRYSRHPNYFFESVIWWGFWLLACGSPWGWGTIYAPLLLLHFLLRVTGIPLTEKCAVESKGDAYREYQRATSAFVPWFPKRPQ
jgi:steroid 5-alpha reductase family enzyme